MNAPSQTTPVGWFYADAKPHAKTSGWDGSRWPEITGYRSNGSATSLPAAFVDQLVQVELFENKPEAHKTAAELIAASSPMQPAATTQRRVTESHAVELVLEENGVASASATLRLFVFLALLLATVAVIVGVLL